MKKLLTTTFTLLFLLAMLLPGASVVYAAPPTEDAQWTCYHDYPLADCPSPNDSMSPYQLSGTTSGTYYMPSLGLTGANLICTPTPDCINDYDIYYQVIFSVSWWDAQAGVITQEIGVAVNGQSQESSDYKQTFDCGTSTGGSSGSCSGNISGVIPAAEIVEAVSPTVYAWEHIYSTATWPPQGYSVTWEVFFSLQPFGEDCMSKYVVPASSTYEMDPTLELPLGVHGSPPDDQMQPTTTGEIYMIDTDGGPWSDGTNPERYDTAISWDGETWTPLNMVSALCIDWEPDHPDLRTIFVEAVSDTLYIRVNDTGGEDPSLFLDNTTVNPDYPTLSPMKFTYGLAIEAGGGTCESQFSYDPQADLQADITLSSTARDTYTDGYIAQEWYGVEVVSGTWHEPDNQERTDTEYVFNGTTATTWDGYSPLTEGSPGVECTSTDGKNVVFVQATNTILHLRVNDQDNNFNNNTGTLNINIYHATFNRTPDVCEAQFQLGDVVLSGSVDAKKQYGQQFAYAEAVQTTPPPYQVGDWHLTPGAWYALETTDGPWGYTGMLHGDGALSYDTAINYGDVNWTSLADWDYPVCNVEVDALGHRRVYFQMPDPNAPDYAGSPWTTGTDVDWKIRVDDTEAWTTNIGSMGIVLYEITDLQTSTSDCGGYTTDPTSIYEGYVDASVEIGTYVPGTDPNTVYKIVIETSTGGWREAAGEALKDDMQISFHEVPLDTWADLSLENASPVVCIQATEEGDLAFIVQTSDIPTIKLRVDSTTFNNNVGGEYFKVYRDVTAPTPCQETIQTLGGLQVLNPHEWIPVKESNGDLVTSEYNYPEAGGLLPDSGTGTVGSANGDYVIEIEYGSGPWFTNSSDTTGSHQAQLSKDGGSTWFDMRGSGTGTDVTCEVVDPLQTYAKVLVHVEQGDIYRIRVADGEDTTFDDNTGNLAYKLYGAGYVDPTNDPGDSIPMFSVNGGDVCVASVVSPGQLSLSEVSSLGNYLASWLSYFNLSFMRYLALCPRHMDMLDAMIHLIWFREPFGILGEIDQMMKDVKANMNGYDWGSDSVNYSILTSDKGTFINTLDRYLLGPMDASSPWAGGNLLNISELGNNPYSTTCSLTVTDYLGPIVGKGMCFLVSILNGTGMMFFVQLLLDLSTVFLVFTFMYNAAIDAVSMLIGVYLPRIWRGGGSDGNNIPDILRNVETIRKR